jgi:hypothetical protein
MYKVAACIACPQPSMIAEIKNHRRILKSGIPQLGSMPFQGEGVEDFRDAMGNDWLLQPEYLREGQYIEALKLRSKTTGVRINLVKLGHNVPP